MISVMKAIWPARLNLLIRIAFCSSPIQQQMPAYKILLRNSVENQIKLPSQDLLKNIRSRGILRVMSSNHIISDQSKVLETHIQCLYALTQRSQPSIEAYSMFAQKVFKEVIHIQQGKITPTFLNLFNHRVVSKLCRIIQSIDSYFNQSFRTLNCILICKLLYTSNGNFRLYKTKMRIMLNAVKKCQSQRKSLIEENGNVVQLSQLQKYKQRKQHQISMEFRHLERYDFWCGFRTLVNLDYYHQDLFDSSLQALKYEIQKYFRQLKIHEIINFLQIIYDLQRYKNNTRIEEGVIDNLNILYNRLVDLYFKQLSNQQILFELVNSDTHIIQSNLITQFITVEHFEKAKNVYLNIFKMTLNSIENGGLLIDIRRLRGFFQVVLIMFTHQDTKHVHSLLHQLQKIMILYPLQRFRRLETHTTLCEKYGYQSQIIAQQYFHYLLYQKQKNDRYKNNLHLMQHCTRQMILAKKFLIYLSITNNSDTQKVQLASKIINAYFQRGIWPFLDAGSIQGFLDATSFYNYIYYQKHLTVSLSTGTFDRKKIQAAAAKLGLKNINSSYHNVIDSYRMYIHRYNSKTSSLTQWKDNPHARMTTILQLAAFNYQYLKKTDQTAAENFIQQFMSKTISYPQFYNTFKHKIAYPGLFKAYHNLMSLLNPQSYALQFKDLQAIKKIYQNQLNRLLQSPKKPPFQIIYQGYLDLLQFNRVLLPYTNDIFNLSYVGHSAYQTEICSVLKLFEKQKEALKTRIQTYSKFNKSKEITVTINFIDFPHYADVKITIKTEVIFLIYQSYQGIDPKQVSAKHLQSITQSEFFWKKNGHSVQIIKGEKDIQDFLKKKIAKITFSK